MVTHNPQSGPTYISGGLWLLPVCMKNIRIPKSSYSCVSDGYQLATFIGLSQGMLYLFYTFLKLVIYCADCLPFNAFNVFFQFNIWTNSESPMMAGDLMWTSLKSFDYHCLRITVVVAVFPHLKQKQN